jgi:hypothetical protein
LYQLNITQIASSSSSSSWPNFTCWNVCLVRDLSIIYLVGLTGWGMSSSQHLWLHLITQDRRTRTQHHIHAPSGIRTHDFNVFAVQDSSCLWLQGVSFIFDNFALKLLYPLCYFALMSFKYWFKVRLWSKLLELITERLRAVILQRFSQTCFMLCELRLCLRVSCSFGKVRSLCFNWAPRHEGVLGSGGLAPCVLELGTRWRWVVSFTPWPLYRQGKSLWYPLDRRLGGSRTGLDAVVTPPGIEPP